QHLALWRDVDLLVVDAAAPFGNGYLLPRGRLREPLSSMARASAVLVTRASQAPRLDELKATGRAAAPAVPSWLTDFAAGAGVDRIVTTEKDAVKLAQLIQTLAPSPVASERATGTRGEGRVRGDIWAVRIDLQWYEGFEGWMQVVING